MQCVIKQIPIKLKSLDEKKCYEYLMLHPTKEIREITTLITEAANHVESKYHRDLIKHLAYIGLSACCRNKEYVEILSNVLSVIKGKRIDIKVTKEFGKLQMILIRLLMRTAYKIIQEKPRFSDLMSELLQSCNNDVISLIYEVISEDIIKRFNEKEQKMLLHFFELGLYIIYQDTAYRDLFFWTLNKYARPEIRKVIRPFVKPPHKWYPNVWIRGGKESQELRDKGVIPYYEHSLVERKMVPAKNMSDLARHLKRKR